MANLKDSIKVRIRLLIFLSAGVFVIGLIAFLCRNANGFTLFGVARPDEWGQFGDFVGGIVGTIISAATLYAIYKSYFSERSEARKSEIEGRFLKMVELHRQNVSETVAQTHVQGSAPKIGRAYFQGLANDLKYIESALLSVLHEKSEINDYLVKYGLLGTSVKNGAWSYLLTGDLPGQYFCLQRFWEEKSKAEAEVLTKENREQTIVIRTLGDQASFDALFKTKFPYGYNQPYSENYSSGYQGARYALGHYFTHLFQTVSYIDCASILSGEEKYRYVKMLRAQLSSDEQKLLFYNSLLGHGLDWEIKYTVKGGAAKDDPEKWLLTKYNLIKNIHEPDEYMMGCYPLVEYECIENLPACVKDERRKLGFHVS